MTRQLVSEQGHAPEHLLLFSICCVAVNVMLEFFNMIGFTHNPKLKRKNMKQVKKTFAVVLLAACSAIAIAQSTGIKREVLQKSDISSPGREVVMARVEVDAGGHVGRHTHAGEEIAYITEGETELLIEGEAPRNLKAGDSFIIPAGKIHSAKNTGAIPLKLIGTYIVEKNKPLATPAP